MVSEMFYKNVPESRVLFPFAAAQELRKVLT